MRTVVLIAALAVGTLVSQSAVAQQALPGDPCPTNGLMTQSTGPEISGAGHFMLCVGSTWRSLYSFNNSAQITKIGDQTCATNEILKFNGSTWSCATDNSSAIAPDSLNFVDFIDAMTLDASTSIAGGNAFDLSLTSNLSAGARSTALFSLTQTDHATNNSTAGLLSLFNLDTGSTFTSALHIQQAAANGYSIQLSSLSNPGSNGLISSTLYSTGVFLSAPASGLTSGLMMNFAGNSSAALTPFTGDIIRIYPSKTHTGATSITETGNFLDIARSDTVNNAGGTYNHTGDLVTLSSTMTQTAGIITDSSSILSVAQNYTGATGDAFELINAGTGFTMRVNDDGTATDTTPFIIDSSGNVAIQKTSAATALDVAGTVTATGFSGSGASLTSLNAANLSSGTIPAARMPALTGDVTMTAGTTTTAIAAGVVTTTEIAADTITAADIATGAVGSSEIADLSIVAADIANATITAAKLASGVGGVSAVTTASCNSTGTSACTATCTAGYFRTGCSLWSTSGTAGVSQPAAGQACQCQLSSGLNAFTCHAYCAQ